MAIALTWFSFLSGFSAHRGFKEGSRDRGVGEATESEPTQISVEASQWRRSSSFTWMWKAARTRSISNSSFHSCRFGRAMRPIGIAVGGQPNAFAEDAFKRSPERVSAHFSIY